MNKLRNHATRFIKAKSEELGFFYCGISKATFLEDEAPHLEKWLNKGMHGKMSYMENHFDKRLNPRLLVDGAKSVVSLLFNYYPEETLSSDFKLSKYAYGEDYHYVIKDKLNDFYVISLNDNFFILVNYDKVEQFYVPYCTDPQTYEMFMKLIMAHSDFSYCNFACSADQNILLPNEDEYQETYQEFD